MTGTVALIRKIHAAVTAEREQRKRPVVEQHARLAIKTLCAFEIACVKAVEAGADLDCMAEIAARVRAQT